jgi:hypothetical protein
MPRAWIQIAALRMFCVLCLDGQLTWTPADSGVAYGTYGLRVQVSLVGNRVVLDRSTEPFAVPENTNTLYVNFSSIPGITPCSIAFCSPARWG